MTQVLRQASTVTVLIGPFVDSGNGYTAEGVLTIAQADVRISKNGGNMVQKNDATSCTHDEIGYYSCPLNATDTSDVGTLVLAVAGDATSLPVRHEFQVVDEVVYDALYSDNGTFITSQDLGILVDSTLGTPTNQTTFPLQSGDVTADDEFIGSMVQIEDASGGGFHVSWVTDSTASTDTIVINSAPAFTAVSGDLVRIYAQQHPTYALNTYDPPTRTEATSDKDAILADIATVDTVVDAVKVKTDQMNFGVTNELDVNVESINATTVLGIGTAGNLWRGS